MPDDSIECILGRMEQRLDNLQEDLSELKVEQKNITEYITTQKIGMKLFFAIVVALGSTFVYYKEHLEQLIFGTNIKTS